jgi:hypothetical protein
MYKVIVNFRPKIKFLKKLIKAIIVFNLIKNQSNLLTLLINNLKLFHKKQ